MISIKTHAIQTLVSTEHYFSKYESYSNKNCNVKSKKIKKNYLYTIKFISVLVETILKMKFKNGNVNPLNLFPMC